MDDRHIHPTLEYFQASFFFMLAVIAVYVVLMSSFYPWQRVYLGVGTPHAYKLLTWCLFGLLALKPVYGWRFGLALFFWYPLNETIGNTLYFVWHIWQIPTATWFSAQNWTVLVIFPLVTLWAWWMLNTTGSGVKIAPRWFFLFLVVQLVWLGDGFHVQYDVCCAKLLTGDLFTEMFDMVWSFAWILGAYGSTLAWGRWSSSASSSPPA